MSKTIQIRNVPEDLHKQLKARAALAGMSLSDFLLAEIGRFAEPPTPAEWRARLAQRLSTVPATAPVVAIRAERNRR